MQQRLPFTVLKQSEAPTCKKSSHKLQQRLPFTVLKSCGSEVVSASAFVATALTVYGIETNKIPQNGYYQYPRLQQLLPFTVCAEGCETAEEQSEDEVRTSQVPERSEGKTRAIRDLAYRLRY